jgi:hypothetical protein
MVVAVCHVVMDDVDVIRELKGHFNASTGCTLRILYPAALIAFCFAPSLQSPLPVASVTSHDRGALALGIYLPSIEAF